MAVRVPATLGVCSWSLRPHDPANLIESLRLLGISAVQLALVPLIADPRHWSDCVEALRAAGIRILSGMLATIGEDYSTLESIAQTGGFRRDDTWRGNLDRALRLADLAAEGGIRLVTVHAGFMPHNRNDPVRLAMLERLRDVAGVFGRRGIALALETGQETAETLVDVLAQLECPSVGVNFDPANMILYGMGDPVQALVRLSPWVRQVHIKDAIATKTPGTWGREVPAGKGEVDWKAFAEAYRKLPQPVDLVIEREAGPDRITDIAAARDLATPMLQ